LAVAIRDKGTCEVLIPAARFDPFALLKLVELAQRFTDKGTSRSEQKSNLKSLVRRPERKALPAINPQFRRGLATCPKTRINA